jgi:hypothetical protein
VRIKFITHMVIYMAVLLGVMLTINARFYTICVIWALFTYIICKEIIEEFFSNNPLEQHRIFTLNDKRKIFLAFLLIALVAWATVPASHRIHVLIGLGILNLFFSLFIHNQNALIMATNEQFEALLTRIDLGTNRVAQELRDIKEELKNMGLSKADEDRIVARLDNAATKLESVGKEDPEESQPDESQPDESLPDTTLPGNQG